MSYLRNHIARITLLVALLTLTGVYGYYYACEWAAKWAFAHQTYFAENELILIAIAQADLTPETANLLSEGEFMWQGDMVDALHHEVRSDTLYVYGFRDVAETKLRQEAAWLYGDKAGTDKVPGHPEKRVKWLNEFVLPHPVIVSSITGFAPFLEAVFCYSLPRPKRPHLDVFAPPPDFF